MRPRCQHLTLRVARRTCIGWQTGWPPWVSRRGDGIHPASVLTPPDSSWSPQATTPGGGDLKPRGRCATERRRSSRRQVSPKRYLASKGYPLLRPPPRVTCHTRFFHEMVPASPLDIHKSVWGTQYLSIRDTERLTRAGIEPSVGSRDDAYDQRPRRDGDRGVSPARFMNAPGQTVKVRRHSRRSILPTIRRYPCGFMNNAGGRLR